MMLFVAETEQEPAFWVTLTFADEQIDNCDPEALLAMSSRTMEKFRKRVKRRWPWMGIVWRREWEVRKSGRWKGELIPHIHAMVYLKADTPGSSFYGFSRALRVQWVKSLPKQDDVAIKKAMKVALHDRSWARLNNVEHALKYVSKYMAKADPRVIEGDYSLGRMWGVWGKRPEMAQGVLIRVPMDKVEQVGRALAEKVRGSDGFREKVEGCKSYVLLPRYEAMGCFEAVFL
jgi:hypothetical protein